MTKNRERTTPYHSAPFDTVLVPHPLERLIRLVCRTRNRQAILALFNHRVTWGSIKHWRKGRRPVPEWAREAINKAAAPKIEELTRLREALQRESLECDQRTAAIKEAARHRLRVMNHRKREEKARQMEKARG